ncbi:MAG: decaprenyl-phosphate phosphoribosyltransferase [Anaerolineae bacterium]|nr:decaprenyl-phosphate phosphoribosyltransferase [Anaerolineae bacterium]
MSETTQAKSTALWSGSQAALLLKTMRPKQWTKNIFVWAALVFDVKLFQPQPFLRTLLTFVLFCIISSAVYIINDLVDIEKDRLHPEKRRRPLASGALSPRLAAITAAALILISLPLALWEGALLTAILYGYLLLMVAYSFWLKNIVIVDVMTIAAGFVLRVAAGVAVVEAERFSPWIYFCMVLLALFLGLGKRRQEIMLMAENSGNTRSILAHYNLRFVDEMLSLVSASTVLTYALYTFSAPNLPSNHSMMLTVPFVLYGLFRYLYLIHVKGETDPPDVVVLKDRPLQIDVLLFGLTVFVVFYGEGILRRLGM